MYDVSTITLSIISHIGDMFDDFVCGRSSYHTFIEKSHAYVRSVGGDVPEHEIYLIQDTHYNLLHEAFVKHFKNTQNS
jgi:hypothetical protein